MISNKLAIAGLSLGQHPSHSLDNKIKAAAEAGYAGIEIIYSDLEVYSDLHKLSLLEGAERVNKLCQNVNLQILALASFQNYEGDRSPLNSRLERAERWIEIARKLRALYLQIPSNYRPDAVGDEAVIISDLRHLATIGDAKQPRVSIAYEFLSWGTHCSTWETALRYVELVNRPNFGLCLDTFHIGTKLWGDLFAPSGKFAEADAALKDSLDRFTAEIPVEKIFFVQLSDAERFDPPFSKDHPWYTEGEAPEFSWSNHGRPFPYEHDLGAYLPITDIAKVWIVDIGFKGWVSMEIFDRGMKSKESRPEIAAFRGIESWKNLQRELGQST
ncbi:hypothetical protein N7462_006809 [Penicillium macrosclerotiorum]|uniref:uncharacterized protein n=1 Tax=Penicillium macrosclerotiorum TaxID=303699 RepID=UPI0025479978|nr:uncharacterized protein N7462_006809 [Penicillium macrosclerotiorum]KAJ5683644.1 hypothetical protein N7462_006809 [Penicillium macrosclerotiorum]